MAEKCKTSGPNLVDLLTAEFCTYDHYSQLDIVQAPNLCASRGEDASSYKQHTRQQAQNISPLTHEIHLMYIVSAEFPASASTDSWLKDNGHYWSLSKTSLLTWCISTYAQNNQPVKI